MLLERLEIQLTPKCNLRCIYCGNDQKFIHGNNIKVDYALKAINDFKPKTVLFTGGEVYLAWNILIEILEKTKHLNYEKILSSNLTLISIQHLKKLIVDYDFKIFHSSFNDLDVLMTKVVRKGNESSRKNLIKNLKFLSTQNISLKVETIIMKDTVSKLKEINDFLFSIGVLHHKLEFLLPIGNATTELMASKYEIISAIKNLYKSKNKNSIIEITCYPYLACDEDSKEIFKIEAEDFIFNKCIDVRSSCYLLANGKLLPCFLFPEEDSNIHVTSNTLMYEFEHNAVFNTLRKVDEKCLKCDKYYNNNLPGYKKCNHGCIVLDYLLSKKYNQNSLEGSVLA